MKRCLQTITGDSTFLSLPFKASSGANHSLRTSRRSFKLQAYAASPQPRISEQSVEESKSIKRRSTDLSPRRSRRQEWLESRGVRPAHKAVQKGVQTDYAVLKALKFLKDPLKLAEHVRISLKAGDFDTTLAIVRAASKDVQCTVAWNHLIDWQLSQGKMNAAIKTYNEMKKRAQVPDAHTYTIIFRGCAEHRNSAEALTKVMSVYQGMLLDTSPVKPNSIHMNALLKMCARARDLDALFAIANYLPEKGIRAANNLTYTTILNALRMHALTNPEGGRSPLQERTERRDAIVRSRLIWADVVTRWRKGIIWIDEELVSTMGRTLLLGDAGDIDDIFSLIEQSMNIPRQMPRISPPRTKAGPGSQEPKEREMDQGDINQLSIVNNTSDAANQDHDTLHIEEFTTITPTKSPVDGTGAYAKPGQNSLSLVMQALLHLHLKIPVAKSPAVNYWNIFTNNLRVVPDGENYVAYLRILRVFRASTEAVELLQQMPKRYMAHKVFRIAISTCHRDKLNHHAFSNAGKILDLMQSHLEVPDIRTLITYLDVALTSPAYSDRTSSDGKSHYSKYIQGKQILRALQRLGPSFVNIRSLLTYGDPTDAKINGKQKSSEFLDEVLSLTQHMIRATDILMNKALVPREMYQQITKQRSKLAAFVTRHKHGKLGQQLSIEGVDNKFDFVEGDDTFKVPISPRDATGSRHRKKFSSAPGSLVAEKT